MPYFGPALYVPAQGFASGVEPSCAREDRGEGRPLVEASVWKTNVKNANTITERTAKGMSLRNLVLQHKAPGR